MPIANHVVRAERSAKIWNDGNAKRWKPFHNRLSRLNLVNECRRPIDIMPLYSNARWENTRTSISEIAIDFFTPLQHTDVRYSGMERSPCKWQKSMYFCRSGNNNKQTDGMSVSRRAANGPRLLSFCGIHFGLTLNAEKSIRKWRVLQARLSSEIDANYTTTSLTTSSRHDILRVNGATENAGVEISTPSCRGGKCGSWR